MTQAFSTAWGALRSLRDARVLELFSGVPEADSEDDDELGSFTASSREGAMFKLADVTTKFGRK